MATKKVTEKILEDAKREAKEIIEKFKKEATKIKDEYTEKIAAKKKQIETEVEATKRIEIMRTLSQKRLELSKQLTEQKHKFINEATKDALKELSKHKNYFDFLKELIRKSGEKDGELIISNHDTKRYGTDLEKFMKVEGLNYNIKSDNEIGGGVIVKKGKITYLGSLDIISELLTDELAIDVSRILW